MFDTVIQAFGSDGSDYFFLDQGPDLTGSLPFCFEQRGEPVCLLAFRFPLHILWIIVIQSVSVSGP
jgi:hypothetical protein